MWCILPRSRARKLDKPSTRVLMLAMGLYRGETSPMPWTVKLHREVARRFQTLPQPIQDLLRLLLEELERQGPVRGNWPNYSKLSRTRHHCHLKRGRPTYVAVWDVRDSQQRRLEVTYVGTHER